MSQSGSFHPAREGRRYAQAMGFLDGLGHFGIRLGLHRIETILASLGGPERRIPHVIQVAGTNGKGSVSAMAAAVLQAARQRTGLYTSPHLVHTTERFRIDGQDVARGTLAAAIARVRPLVEALAAVGDPATAFEVLTVSSYLIFAQAGVDWLVQEVGLGGPLDSTNVLPTHDVTVITNIGLDHTEYLGSTLAAIAAEEAGLMRAGRPLVTAARGEALAVLRRRAGRLGAPLVRVVADGPDPDQHRGEAVVRVRLRTADLGGTRFDLAGALGTFEDLAVPLCGAHQSLNGAVAAAALLLVGDAAGIDEAALRSGLAATRWPGRLELVRRRPPVLLDGAHNRDGLAALLQGLSVLVPGRRLTLVFGLLAEKELALSALRERPPGLALRALAVTPPAGRRALPATETARRLRALGVPAEPVADIGAALDRAVQSALHDRPVGAVCVCGSLYLVGEVRRQLRGRRRPSPGGTVPPDMRGDGR